MCNMSEQAPKLPLALCRSTESGVQQQYTKRYDGIKKSDPFCDPNPEDIRQKGDLFYVIENIFPYEMWDRFEVEDHVMLNPFRHALGMGDLTTDEKLEWMDVVAEYENQGYSHYTRGQENKSRSLEHMHTHLILLGRRALTRQWYDVRSQTSLFRFEGDTLEDMVYPSTEPTS